MARQTLLSRQLRQQQTDAEARLWSRLRNRALGPKFRRQAPFGPFVLDLWCAEAMLAIEVDGAHHLAPEELARDAARTAFLEAAGVRVARFLDNEVLLETDAVVQRIADLLAEPAPPHPVPLPRGGGEGG